MINPTENPPPKSGPNPFCSQWIAPMTRAKRMRHARTKTPRRSMTFSPILSPSRVVPHLAIWPMARGAQASGAPRVTPPPPISDYGPLGVGTGLLADEAVP